METDNAGDEFCAACAPNARGIYPNCTLEERDPIGKTWCTVARLPDTLLTPGQLRTDGTAYLQVSHILLLFDC